MARENPARQEAAAITQVKTVASRGRVGDRGWKDE